MCFGSWGLSSAIGCSGSSNDFFEGVGARSGGSGALAGNGGTAGDAPARGGSSAFGGNAGSGQGGAAAAAQGGDAGANGDSNAGEAGNGDAGAPTHASGGAATAGNGGSADGGDGNAGVAGGTSDGGSHSDAGDGGRTSGDGGRSTAGGVGGELAMSGSGGEGEGGADAGGRDGEGGATTEGGAPNQGGTSGADAGAGGRQHGGEGGQHEPCATAERCDGVDNDCNDGIDEGRVCPQGCRGFDIGGRAYMFCSSPRGHFASANVCEEANMDLVRIESASENTAVLAAVERLSSNARPGSIHIGATDFGTGNEGNFRWTDGALFWIGAANGSAVNGAYENWDAGEPNNYETNEDCVEMLVAALAEKAGLWNDVRCRTALSFVCEE